MATEGEHGGSKMLQRGIVAALVVAVVGGAAAAYLVASSQIDSRRSERATSARDTIAAALGRRAYYLEDVADMVGVHNDADVAEFTRYAHVRGLDEARDAFAVEGVQWVRRSPSGRLAPAGDVPPHTDLREPLLLRPPAAADEGLANAAAQPKARRALRAAALGKRVEASGPVRLRKR